MRAMNPPAYRLAAALAICLKASDGRVEPGHIGHLEPEKRERGLWTSLETLGCLGFVDRFGAGYRINSLGRQMVDLWFAGDDMAGDIMRAIVNRRKINF